MTETKVEETRDVIARRVSPGDRWKSAKFNNETIFESLTDMLEYHYQQTGKTEYFLSARSGTVEVIDKTEVTVERSVTKYSLYGEE
jgi:hypothetical protein